MPEAAGVFKQLIYKAETTYGTLAGASGAQRLRRVTSDLDLKKDVYESNEIRSDQQMADYRHGVRRPDGTINGELSPKTYADFFAAALRRDFSAGVSVAGASITIAGSGPTYTLTRSAGSWLTDGVKKGDVGRLTAGVFAAANLNKNLVVASMTATVLTVRTLNGSTLVAEGPIASATFAVTGKKTYAPTSAHTNKSFSIEHLFSDMVQSEVFTGCQPSQIDLNLPPTGIATVAIQLMAKDLGSTGSSAYFTSPTAETTTGVLTAVNGLLLIGGAAQAVLTGLQLTIQSPRTGDPVVGSNTIPTKFPGRVRANAQATAYFADATLRDAFKDETITDVILVLSVDNTAGSDFVAIAMPRCKVGGSSKNDGEGAIVQTIPIQAIFNGAGGSGQDTEQTTIVVQDSAA